MLTHSGPVTDQHGDNTVGINWRRTDSSWDPLHSLKLQMIYRPAGEMVRALLASVDYGTSSSSKSIRILQVGGEPEVLSTILRSGSTSPKNIEVHTVSASPENPLDAHPGIFDCVIAIDYLPQLPPSARKQTVETLCQAARHGVILINPFFSNEVLEASQLVNKLHRAAHRADHPLLGKALEFGFPDTDVTAEWIKRFFPHVAVHSVDTISVWQTIEMMTVSRSDAPDSARKNDRAAIETLAPLCPTINGENGFNSLVVASKTALLAHNRAKTSDISPSAALYAAVTLQQASEIAGHRRALEQLHTMIGQERAQERQEFQETLSSLASELRELDAQAEKLADEVRERDHRIANQTAAIAAEQQGAVARQRHLEEHIAALEAARQHAEKLLNEVRDRDHRIANQIETMAIEQQAAAARQRQLEEHIAALEAARQRLEDHIAALEAARKSFAASRAGRTLARYARIKSWLIGNRHS